MDPTYWDTGDSDRLPGDPTPAEIAELCRQIREVGFQPSRRGAPYHPPWSSDRICNTRKGPAEPQLKVICTADMGRVCYMILHHKAKKSLSLY